MVDVGQFLGLRAAKRAGPSAPAPGRLGIFAGEAEPIPQQAVRFSARQIAALFVTLAAIASVPILLYPWPPLSDYINHLARMHVIATIRSDPNLALFYEVEWQVIPNLMMDLIVPILQRVMNLRLAVSTLFVLALFFCHLFAVGVYGLALFAFELQRLLALRARKRAALACEPAPQRQLPAWVDFVASGIPFLPVLPLLLMSPTWTLRWDFTWELGGKVTGLLYVIEVYSRSATFFLATIVAIAALFAIRHRALRFHPFGWVLLAVGGITYLALPRVLFDTYMADQRLPIALAFMIIACAHLDLRDEFVRRGFATVLVLLLTVRAFELHGVWRERSPGTASFRESVRHTDRGSKVLVAYADPDNGDNARDLWLTHAACLAIIERSALVTTAFTVLGKQVMHVRRDYRDRVDTEDGPPPALR